MDAENGLQCRLPAHADVVHRNERGPFTNVAAPGQTTFAKVEQLVAAATARTDAGLAVPFWGKGDALSVKGGALKRAVRRTRRPAGEVAHA